MERAPRITRFAATLVGHLPGRIAIVIFMSCMLFGAILSCRATEFSPELVLPQTMYALQSLECNLYFDNVLMSNYKDFHFELSSTVANGTMRQHNERFSWIPVGAVNSGSMRIRVISKYTGETLSSGSINLLSAAASNGLGTIKKAIFIGDSLIDNGAITQTMLDLAGVDSMGITLLGTRGSGANRHEGRSGWTITAYTSNYSDGTVGANPFWIGGAVNFSQYLTNNSIAIPDWVFIDLGINEIFLKKSDNDAKHKANSDFLNLDTLISSIKAAGVNVKVGLIIPSPPSYDQDSFALSQAFGRTRTRFKRNILVWARELIKKYAGQEASRIYIVPSNLNLDTENNMSSAASAPINSRSTVNKARQNNGVHPGTTGYQQIGDAVWAFLKYHA